MVVVLTYLDRSKLLGDIFQVFTVSFTSTRTGVNCLIGLGNQTQSNCYTPRHGCHRSGNGQGKKNSSRSGKCQGILFWVRENWHFEEKSGKIEITSLI